MSLNLNLNQTPAALRPTPVPGSFNGAASQRWLGAGWLLALMLALAWDRSGLDLWVMQRLGSPQGFALRHNFWLETVLHDGARAASWLALLALAGRVWRPAGALASLSRRQRLAMLAGVLLSLLLVSALKRWSASSCPWDLQAFGGLAQYRPHGLWAGPDGGPGRCFPAGHASAALAYLSVPVTLLTARQAALARAGWSGLALVLLAGGLLGAAQTLRGAHYPSHTLWTLLVCASVAWAVQAVAGPGRGRP